MINRVIVLNNPLKYTDPSGHGFFSRVWKGIRRAVSSAVKSVERRVRAAISEPKNLFTLAAVAVSAYFTWGATSAIFGAEGIGAIVSSSITAGVSAYNTYDKYSSLPVGTSGGSGGSGGDVTGGANPIIQNLVRQGKYQAAIDFSASYYGYQTGVYRPSDPYFKAHPGADAHYSPDTNEIIYSRNAFLKPTQLQSTGFHESVHYYQNNDFSGFYVKPIYKNMDVGFMGKQRVLRNRPYTEMQAYGLTINHARNLNLTSNMIQRQINKYNEIAREAGAPEWQK